MPTPGMSRARRKPFTLSSISAGRSDMAASPCLSAKSSRTGMPCCDGLLRTTRRRRASYRLLLPISNVPSHTPTTQPTRITSIDALRGFVMFMMIFVNDLSGAGKIVPDWMLHFSDRHPKGSGMTFVDLVFPAFLFIVGMSVPFALGGRMAKGEPFLRTLGHVAVRTISLLLIGILMVHETPDTVELGWLGNCCCV